MTFGRALQVAIVRACGRQLIEELAIGGEPSVLAQKVRLDGLNTVYLASASVSLPCLEA